MIECSQLFLDINLYGLSDNKFQTAETAGREKYFGDRKFSQLQLPFSTYHDRIILIVT